MALPQTIGATGFERLYVDYVMIGGDKSPGKATVHGASIKRGWDIRKGTGLSGAVVVPTGDELAKFGVRFEFWESAQVDAWFAFAKRYFDAGVRFGKDGKPRALGIWHPVLNATPLNITDVVVEEVSQLEQDEVGLWSCEVQFLQYRPPQRAPDPPEASIPAVQKPTPTAKDEAERELQEKAATFKRLAGF